MSTVNRVFSAFLEVGAIPGGIVELTLALLKSVFWRHINIVHVIELSLKLQLIKNWNNKPLIGKSALGFWSNAWTCNFSWASFCLGASWTGKIYAYSKSKERKLQKQLPSERRVQGFLFLFCWFVWFKHFQSSLGNFLICGFLDLCVPKRAWSDLWSVTTSATLWKREKSVDCKIQHSLG